jgi:hypothetical protein
MFNPAVAQLVGDTDLTNAHGSSGVVGNGVLGGRGIQAVTQILSSKASGGSGYAAVGEQSTGYANSRTSSTDAYGAWGVDARLSTTDVTTHGSDTQHINTQAAGTLTASTGTDAANGVSGNLGVSIAEGIGNAQSNDVSLASIRPDWRACR